MDRARFERLLVQQTSRRRLLGGGAAAAGLAVAYSFRDSPTRSARIVAYQTSPDASPVASPVATPIASTFTSYPFSLGVASGDPLPDGVVLWTRLAPDPLAEDGRGGLTGQPALEVTWEVSTDEAFTNGNVVQTGSAIASPDLGYSVHADVSGLEPARAYFYRFIAGGETSPVGRTRTAPAAGAAVERLRLGFASCSMWEHGYFNAYRDMAQSDLDLILHLGDYIYEYEATGYAIDGGPVRTVTGPETVNLLDYRNRHALYKTDPDLQAAHAAAPWIVTWDDHETENDYAAAISENGDPEERFLLRRANAYQAYYEHLPLRPKSMPQGPDMQLYRRLSWGNLAEFQVLDTRQYRSDQPCGDGVQVRCPAALDPATTMLGPGQEQWLLAGLDASTTTWNILAQQLMMARLEQMEGPGEKFWGDGWDMYTAARTRILSHVMSRGIPNTVVITGDIHTAWANDLKGDFEDTAAPAIASEYICTSVSAGGDSSDSETFEPFLAENPHIKYFDGAHGGYTRVELTPERWQAEFLTVADLRDPASGLETIATYVTEAGSPGVQPA